MRHSLFHSMFMCNLVASSQQVAKLAKLAISCMGYMLKVDEMMEFPAIGVDRKPIYCSSVDHCPKNWKGEQKAR